MCIGTNPASTAIWSVPPADAGATARALGVTRRGPPITKQRLAILSIIDAYASIIDNGQSDPALPNAERERLREPP
jgi:hypothetical protein